jgi:hypothetical protein
MKNLPIIIGIILIIFMIFTILFVECIMTFKYNSCGTIVYDFCVKKMKSQIDQDTNISQVVTSLDEVNSNETYVYRQVFIMSVLVSMIATNFFYIGVPEFKLESFFYIFFVIFICNILSFSFINFHYYSQKENVINYGLNKIQTFL